MKSHQEQFFNPVQSNKLNEPIGITTPGLYVFEYGNEEVSAGLPIFKNKQGNKCVRDNVKGKDRRIQYKKIGQDLIPTAKHRTEQVLAGQYVFVTPRRLAGKELPADKWDIISEKRNTYVMFEGIKARIKDTKRKPKKRKHEADKGDLEPKPQSKKPKTVAPILQPASAVVAATAERMPTIPLSAMDLTWLYREQVIPDVTKVIDSPFDAGAQLKKPTTAPKKLEISLEPDSHQEQKLPYPYSPLNHPEIDETEGLFDGTDQFLFPEPPSPFSQPRQQSFTSVVVEAAATAEEIRPGSIQNPCTPINLEGLNEEDRRCGDDLVLPPLPWLDGEDLPFYLEGLNEVDRQEEICRDDLDLPPLPVWQEWQEGEDLGMVVPPFDVSMPAAGSSEMAEVGAVAPAMASAPTKPSGVVRFGIFSPKTDQSANATLQKGHHNFN